MVRFLSLLLVLSTIVAAWATGSLGYYCAIDALQTRPLPSVGECLVIGPLWCAAAIALATIVAGIVVASVVAILSAAWQASGAIVDAASESPATVQPVMPVGVR